MPKDPKRVAAGKRSKAKGGKWQSDVAKLFSQWSGKTWKSTPRSGGLRWNSTFWTFGDLLPPEDLLLVVECKHYSTIEYIEVLGTVRTEPGGGIVSGWWYGEACADAIRAKKSLSCHVDAVLVWKADRRRPKLTLDLDVFNSLQTYSLVTVTAGIPGRAPYVTVDLAEFVRVVNYERFQEALNLRR